MCSQLITDALKPELDGKHVSIWRGLNGGCEDLYDPANPGFSDLTTMEAGYAYWINTTQACIWSLP